MFTSIKETKASPQLCLSVFPRCLDEFSRVPELFTQELPLFNNLDTSQGRGQTFF